MHPPAPPTFCNHPLFTVFIYWSFIDKKCLYTFNVLWILYIHTKWEVLSIHSIFIDSTSSGLQSPPYSERNQTIVQTKLLENIGSQKCQLYIATLYIASCHFVRRRISHNRIKIYFFNSWHVGGITEREKKAGWTPVHKSTHTPPSHSTIKL